jgi:hypothetical protein
MYSPNQPVISIHWYNKNLTRNLSCRQIFKGYNILTVACLYILEIVCYVKKCTDSLEQNVHFHNYDTLRKLDLHVQFCNTDLFRRSAVNTRIRLCNKVPDHIHKLEKNKLFERELRSFLLQHAFYSVDEFISYWLHVYCVSMWAQEVVYIYLF